MTQQFIQPLVHLACEQGQCVMPTKNAYLVQERIYSLVQLFVGLVFTFGCIGLLGYGLLVLLGP